MTISPRVCADGTVEQQRALDRAFTVIAGIA
jgi:hypothetical protein